MRTPATRRGQARPSDARQAQHHLRRGLGRRRARGGSKLRLGRHEAMGERRERKSSNDLHLVSNIEPCFERLGLGQKCSSTTL